MRRSLIIVPILFLAVLPALSQNPAGSPYTIEFDPEKGYTLLDRYEGKDALFIMVKFVVKGDSKDYKNYKIHIFEDGEKVREVDLPAPKPTGGLSVVLAVDSSAKIKEHQPQVLKAVDFFFNNLNAAEAKAENKTRGKKSADCGLILFNHEIRQTINLSPDREPLRKAISAVEPSGGNACLDAAARAIDMLKDVPADRARAVVLISNGLDQYSKTSKNSVVAEARKHGVTVHTIGIGEASKPQIVNTVLVLDHSGSMEAPADDNDATKKIEGLHVSASRFIEMLPPSARTTLIPFGSVVDVAKPFTGDKNGLTQQIKSLNSEGETALFDAVFSALATLEAYNPPGKKVVIAMTDGIDNISRRRAEEVIERAKDANIPLFMLGFGREKELDAKTLTQMAEQTGGQYFHARNQKALLDFFEQLSFKINEQGIDERTLKDIASDTSKGKAYTHVRDIKNLELALKKVNDELQAKEEVEIFKAKRQVRDGKQRKILLKLVHTVVTTGADGLQTTTTEVLTEQSGTRLVHGVVIAWMDHLVFLTLLAVLGSLILLPAIFRKSPTETES